MIDHADASPEDDSRPLVNAEDAAEVSPQSPGVEHASDASQQRGGLAQVLAASTSGEAASAAGILAAVGGVRGIVEALLPATIFLGAFVFTEDARTSAVLAVALSAAAVLARAIARQPIAPALSGALGVLVCAVSALVSGRGETYYLPGFYINAAWILGHGISLIVGWPLIGVLLGFLRGSLTEWRSIPLLKRAASVCTWIWLLLFSARLAVQLPLYLAAKASEPGAIEALGTARLVMGIPLFALAAFATWVILSRVSSRLSVQESDS